MCRGRLCVGQRLGCHWIFKKIKKNNKLRHLLPSNWSWNSPRDGIDWFYYFKTTSTEKEPGFTDIRRQLVASERWTSDSSVVGIRDNSLAAVSFTVTVEGHCVARRAGVRGWSIDRRWLTRLRMDARFNSFHCLGGQLLQSVSQPFIEKNVISAAWKQKCSLWRCRSWLTTHCGIITSSDSKNHFIFILNLSDFYSFFCCRPSWSGTVEWGRRLCWCSSIRENSSLAPSQLQWASDLRCVCVVSFASTFYSFLFPASTYF